jgi:IclR family acetate operon transcriptional repressor
MWGGLGDYNGRSMIAVISKVSQILDCYSSGEKILSLSELARRTGIPKATVHRIATDLVALRLLDRTENGFALGLFLFELGGLVAYPRSLRELALPFLEDLYEATHHVVHLGVLDKGEVLYIEKITGRDPVEAPSRVAGRMPAHCTAIGKALLAYSPDEMVDEILSRPLEVRTPYTVTAPGKLRRQFEAIRNGGIAQEMEESARGIACLAVPVIAEDGCAAGAVSVSARCLKIDKHRVAPALRMTGLGISRALSQTPWPPRPYPS